MSSIARSAFVGYTYQFQVALLMVFFLEENLFDINQVRPEINDTHHNFDDIWCYRNRSLNDLFIQVKNHSQNEITFRDNKVYFNKKEVVQNQGLINIIVTRNQHNLTNNSEANGFEFYMNDIKDLIVIHLSPDTISDYIFQKFHPSRINQIISLANKKFTDFYNCSINEEELPGLEFMSSDLLEKTILIRNLEINTNNKILFIIGKPGVGKSHLVNEMSVPERQLYRFWIGNQDPERISRLNYNTFLHQLSLKLFGSGRIRTEEEIIFKLDADGKPFYIDGLDHVENYNPSEISKYFAFLDKVNKTKEGKLIILSRPLSNKINYPIYQLQDWSFDETKEYLNQREIKDYSVCRKIYKIGNGYPIITSYLASEWIRSGGKLSYTDPIADLSEYYSIVLDNVKFRNKLSVFMLSSTFFMLDELDIILEDKKNEVFEFIKYYPFLFEIRDERIALIHDSFNNYISSKIDLDPSLKPKLHNFIKKSLMNSEPRFMSRILSYDLDNQFLSSILHKYCKIDEYINLKNSVLDYESVKQFYYSLRKIYAREDIVLLNAEEAYELSMIFTILMRDNIEQSYGLIYQFYIYLQKNKIDWKKHIFSSESIYYAFSFFEGNDIELLYRLETNKGYGKDGIADSLSKQLHYEIDFFKKHQTDNYEKYKHIVTSYNEFQASSYLTDLLVCAYLFDHNEDGLKAIVEQYFKGYYEQAAYGLSRFLKDNGWTHTRPYRLNNIFDARKIIMQLGTNLPNNDYINLSLKEIIQKNASGGSFELNDIINGYIRLANHQNREIDINSITYYLPLYYEHKDYSIIELSEIFYELIIRDKITLEYAFETINIFQEMSDKGVRHLCNDLVNLLGPKYVNEMEELGVLSTYSSYRVWITDLSTEVIDAASSRYIETEINKIINRELESRRIYKDELSLKANEHKSILKSKHSKYFMKKLNDYSIKLIDETYPEIPGSLEITAEETKNREADINDSLDNGIVDLFGREYYQKIGLDYLTFARCGGGWYEKLPYPDFLDLYDKKILKDNMKKILQYIISKSFISIKYDDERIENGSDRGLMSGIPRLLTYTKNDFDWNVICRAIIKMVDVSLGKL